MGRDKLTLVRDAHGRTVLGHVVATVREWASEIRLLTYPNLPLVDLTLAANELLIEDVESYRGPLAAIAAAWPKPEEAYLVFVVAGDLPGICDTVFGTCENALREHPDVDAVLPVREGKVQPLLGCYRPSAGRVFREAVDEGETRLMQAVQRLHIHPLSTENHAWPMWWTRPIHTPAEYREWLQCQEGSQ